MEVIIYKSLFLTECLEMLKLFKFFKKPTDRRNGALGKKHA